MLPRHFILLPACMLLLSGFVSPDAEIKSNVSPVPESTLYWLNYVRTNPRAYADEVVKVYERKLYIGARSEWQKEKKYIHSLIAELYRLSPMQPLVLDHKLTAMASDHVDYTGKKGVTGHVGRSGKSFDKRADQFCGYGYMAENCDYGRPDAKESVMALLIDAGIPDLGHRKNILNPEFNRVGISWGSHKTYRIQCVMDFGKGPQNG